MSGFRYLLDTNIISELMRNPRGVVNRRLSKVEPESVCTSAIVLCELEYGVLKRGGPALIARLRTIAEHLPALPFEPAFHEHYARLRVDLELVGQPIGANDLLIAAHALGLDLTLVTHNVREFSRVNGLKIEDWLA